MPEISSLNRSMTLQPTMNVDELLNSQKTDDAQKTETTTEVGKTDKTGAKTELEEVVHDDTALNGQTAENFVKADTVEAGKDKTVAEEKKTEDADKAEKSDKAEKKDGADKAEKTAKEGEVDGSEELTPFEKAHPKLTLAAKIVELILDAIQAALAEVADKLPNGIGKYLTGGLGVLKGVCGLHSCKDLASASKALSEQIGESAKVIAEGIWGEEDKDDEETNDGKVKVGKLVAGGGQALFGLFAAFKSSDPESAMKTAVNGAASFCEGLNGRFGLTPKVCDQIKGAADKVGAAAPGVVKAIKDKIGELSNKTSKAVDRGLEAFEEAVQENKDIPDESKAFVKKLVAGTRDAIKKDGYKKAVKTYTETIGALLTDKLNEREKKVFDQTMSLIGDIAAEKDPFKACQLVLAKAKELAGGESKELDTVTAAAEEAVKEGSEIVEKADVDATADESSVQTDVGSFQDRLKNLEGLMKKGQS